MTRTNHTPCTVVIAHTSFECHAHVELDRNDIGPGDQVLVHDAPTTIAYGQELRVRREATIWRAGLLARLWTKFIARFELTTLYEVSFSTTRFSTSRRYPRPVARGVHGITHPPETGTHP
jgi:hypothetical protein